jgi:hypothetical protein
VALDKRWYAAIGVLALGALAYFLFLRDPRDAATFARDCWYEHSEFEPDRIPEEAKNHILSLCNEAARKHFGFLPYSN